MSAKSAQGQDVINVNTEMPQRNIRPKYHPLTVPIVAHFLGKGYSPAQIARIMGCSDVAVYRYMQRHSTELELLEDSDILLAKKIDYKNHQIVDSITVKDIKSEEPKDRLIMLGIGVEKSRILQNKATQSIVFEVISPEYQALMAQLKQLEESGSVSSVVVEGEIVEDEDKDDL